MKLYVLLDHLENEKNLDIAYKTEKSADAFIMGSLPLLRYGISCVQELRKAFEHKIIFVETNIINSPREIVSLVSQSGADWVAVMGGARKEVIHAAASKAHDLGNKVYLDIIDAQFSGNEAFDAATLGIDAIMFTYSLQQDDPKDLIESWQMIKGNTTLPIFFRGMNNHSLIPLLVQMAPTAVIVDTLVTDHAEPDNEIEFLKDSLQGF